MAVTDFKVINSSFWYSAGVLLLLIGLYGVGKIESRSDFLSLWGYYGIAFLGYLAILLNAINRSMNRWDAFVVLVSMAVLSFYTPILSEDYYRFAWDGHIQLIGYSPYAHLPSDLIGTDLFRQSEYFIRLFENMNSPEYHSVYPPFMQIIFRFAAWFSGESIALFVNFLKALMLISGAAIFFISADLLRKFSLPSGRIIIFSLNPLVLLECIGNLHFELFQVLFMCMSIWFLNNSNVKVAAGLFGLSMSIKLIPFLLLPFFFKFLGLKKGFIFVLISCLIFAGTFLPFNQLSDYIGIFSSLELYFRKFEFNASVYYLLRELGYWIKGYNTISFLGPALGFLTLMSVFFMFLKANKDSVKDLFEYIIFSLMIYLLLSTTVHPWYIVSMIFFTIFLVNWFVIAWSYLIMLTYSAYKQDTVAEIYWLIAIQYVIVLLILILQNRISLFVGGNTIITIKSEKYGKLL